MYTFLALDANIFKIYRIKFESKAFPDACTEGTPLEHRGTAICHSRTLLAGIYTIIESGYSLWRIPYLRHPYGRMTTGDTPGPVRRPDGLAPG